jgi:hypothetical protein
MVKAHFSVRHFNLADRDPSWRSKDEQIVAHARRQMDLLRRERRVEPPTGA